MSFSEMFPIVFNSLNIGFLQTLKLFLVTLLGAVPLGLIISFGSMTKFSPLRWLTRTVIWIVRGTPLLLQLLIIYYGPGLMGYPIWGGGESGRFLACSIMYIFNYSCYFSEIFRSGIESIPHGQSEAGQVLGLTKNQIFSKIVFMQVVRRILPPMSNEIITLVKDTSLAQILGVVDLLNAAKHAVNHYVILTPFVYATVFYLVFNGLLTVLLGKMEKKLSYYKV